MQFRMIFSMLIILSMGIIHLHANDLPATKTVILPGNVPVEFVLIQPGTFIMGSPSDEVGRHPDEGPIHKVTITKPFYFGKYEVTQQQWETLMEENPSLFKGNPNHPVERITWNEAQAFIAKINNLGIGTFRLPTEAEWEHACRAGTQTRYWWGDDPAYQEVYQTSWFNPITHAQTRTVGGKKPNPNGLYDITGNVWEWCQDWKAPYTEEDQVDPKGPADGKLKVFRGSSWYDEPDMHRSANRHGHAPDERYSTIGFRLVLEAKRGNE